MARGTGVVGSLPACMASEKLIIFCKAPRPGFVKTRLAASVGSEPASRIYMELLQTVLHRVRQVSHIQLCFAPSDACEEVARLRLSPNWELRSQDGGDLGERMFRAFASAFETGSDRVLLIGTDTPELQVSDLQEAFESLRRHDLVLGPAFDGGYWLIGLKVPQPQLFKGIDWSTDRVFAETVRRAQHHGLKTHLLRVLADIDTVEDWQNYQKRKGAS